MTLFYSLYCIVRHTHTHVTFFSETHHNYQSLCCTFVVLHNTVAPVTFCSDINRSALHLGPFASCYPHGFKQVPSAKGDKPNLHHFLLITNKTFYSSSSIVLLLTVIIRNKTILYT